ncbi:Domain unknown function DUF295 - like 10, partial [Theobroma cacao]
KNLTAFTDVIFYKNLAYAIGTRSLTISFDVNSFDDSLKSPKVKILMSTHKRLGDYFARVYLVESSKGDLFSIKRIVGVKDNHYSTHFTESFKVFKLILDDQSGELLEEKEVKNIHEDVVFVGYNQTLAVSILDFPEGKPNSIYFTDDCFIATGYWPTGSQLDNGFFNMKDGKMGIYYQFNPLYNWKEVCLSSKHLELPFLAAVSSIYFKLKFEIAILPENKKGKVVSLEGFHPSPLKAGPCRFSLPSVSFSSFGFSI